MKILGWACIVWVFFTSLYNEKDPRYSKPEIGLSFGFIVILFTGLFSLGLSYSLKEKK